jgi:hypothetical protein
MPTQSRYKNQKFSHDFANADAGNVIHFPDGRVCAVKRKVTQETPEQTTARIEREEQERALGRSREGKYNKTEARKISNKVYSKTPAGKAVKAVKEKARAGRLKERKLAAPFVGIDTEGVSMHDQAWIENEDGEIIKKGADATEENREDKETLYVPQKITVMAAGNEGGAQLLCHAKIGKGRDAPGLSSIEMMKWLCDLPAQYPKGSNFVWYAGSYDASHILKDLPFELGWEIARQMSFDNRGLVENPDDTLDPDAPMPDTPSIRRNVIWITTDPATGHPIGFGINYLKSKWLKIGMLRNPEDRKLWYKARGGLNCTKTILIQDVIGFFQSSFLIAMEGMKSAIEISEKEQTLIDKFKPLRGDFSNQEMSEIIAYNSAEIIILARMMEAFRKALAELGLHPKKWHGPGVIAEMVLKDKGIVPVKKKEEIVNHGHYPEFLQAAKMSVAQDWAHHTFSGGRIELIRQGVHCDPENPIYQYDICSAYPSIIVNLPSMKREPEDRYNERVKVALERGLPRPKRQGGYIKHGAASLSLKEFKTFAANTNMLSMFQVQWAFNEEYHRELSKAERVKICEQRNKSREILFDEMRKAEGYKVPFFPLFYRCNGKGGTILADGSQETGGFPKGTILYPDMGRGRYLRDEILAAIAWCERFPEVVQAFEFEGAMEFLPYLLNPNESPPCVTDKKFWRVLSPEGVKDDPNSYERPFGFVQEMFDRRASIVTETEAKIKVWEADGKRGPVPYNIFEKAIKLILNSLYGKTAQSIGTEGEIPNCTNPFYAGAITAGTRARLLLAALHNPHGIVFFATDGIMSLGPLAGLSTVREKVLGQWEFAHELDVREAAIFVHPGIYSFHDHKGKPQTKTRGFKIDLARDFFKRDIARAWKAGDKYFLVGKARARRERVNPGSEAACEARPEEREGEGREPFPPFLYSQVRDRLKKGEKVVTENKLPMVNTIFMTLGISFSAENNWKKCGSWRTQSRDMNLQSAGTKRMLCNDKRRQSNLFSLLPLEIGKRIN